MLRLTNGDYEYRLGWHAGREPEESMAPVPDCLVPNNIFQTLDKVRCQLKLSQIPREQLSTLFVMDKVNNFWAASILVNSPA